MASLCNVDSELQLSTCAHLDEKLVLRSRVLNIAKCVEAAAVRYEIQNSNLGVRCSAFSRLGKKTKRIGLEEVRTKRNIACSAHTSLLIVPTLKSQVSSSSNINSARKVNAESLLPTDSTSD